MKIVMQKNVSHAQTVCFFYWIQRKEIVIVAQIERYYFKTEEIISRNYEFFEKLVEK